MKLLYSILVSMMLLSLTTSCEKDEGAQQSEQKDDPKTNPIIVTVDADGKADGNHRFVKIDDTNFYIDDIKYSASQGDLLVSGYNDAFFKGAANIISQLNYIGREMHVIGITEKAFYECTVMTSVTIPEGVTSIGKQAFYGCSGLTSVTIPTSVTSIGEGAFRGCSGLTSVTIPEGVKRIGNRAFSGCSGLTSVTIPSSLTSIGDYAFSECSGLTSVTIPEGVTSIGNCAFSRCSGLTSVTIPSSVTSIGEGAFYGCSGLTPVTIPEGVTSIGRSAFSECSSLTSVTIPEGVTSIGNGAFSGCSSLQDFYCYPVNLPSTGSDVFSYSSISSATLHVPAQSLDDYNKTYPWNQFKTKVAL